MEKYNGVERRRSRRVQYPVELWYKDRNKDTQGFKHAYGTDISEHGLLFETYEGFPSCTILELIVEVPLENAEKDGFNIIAEVVRLVELKRQWLYHIGVSFCKMDDDCRSLIKKYTVGKSSESLSRRISLSLEKTAVNPA